MYSDTTIKQFTTFNLFIICICLNCNMQMRFWHPQDGAWDQGKCSKKSTGDERGAGFLFPVHPMHQYGWRNYKSFTFIIVCKRVYTGCTHFFATPYAVGWLFSWLVTHLLIWHFPNSICITAPAQSHVTISAMYALFIGENPT